MPKLTKAMIEYYKDEVRLSLRDIGNLFRVTHGYVWQKANNHMKKYRQSNNGKAYFQHRYHQDFQEGCKQCSLEKRIYSLHSHSY